MVLTMPVVAAAALGALLVLVAASRSTRAFGTIAHESGHMVIGILTGHRIRYFEVTSGGAGATYPETSRWGPGRARFYVEAPKLAPVVRRVDADPRLAAFWAERFPLEGV